MTPIEKKLSFLYNLPDGLSSKEFDSIVLEYEQMQSWVEYKIIPSIPCSCGHSLHNLSPNDKKHINFYCSKCQSHLTNFISSKEPQIVSNQEWDEYINS